MPRPATIALPRLQRPSRRAFLKVGAGFSAALACSALFPTLTGCAPADAPPQAGMAFLRPADVTLFRALLPAIASDLATVDAATRETRLAAAVKNIDGTIAAMDQNGRGSCASCSTCWPARHCAGPWRACARRGSRPRRTRCAPSCALARQPFRDAQRGRRGAGQAGQRRLLRAAGHLGRERLSRPESRGLSRPPQLRLTLMAIDDIYSDGIACGWKVRGRRHVHRAPHARHRRGHHRHRRGRRHRCRNPQRSGPAGAAARGRRAAYLEQLPGDGRGACLPPISTRRRPPGRPSDGAIAVLQGRSVGGSHHGQLVVQLPHATPGRWRTGPASTR